MEPTNCLTWSGIELDTEVMEMRIPSTKLAEIKHEVRGWKGVTRASKKKVQSLLGKLIYISKCVQPARLYLNRIITSLTGKAGDVIYIDKEFQMDINWFDSLLERFNGVSLIERHPLEAYEAVELDSCLSGCGAIFGQIYYTEQFPGELVRQALPIHCLEMLNIVVAVRLWAPCWEGRLVNIWCDNAASVAILQSGKGRDERLLKCAREIWAWAAVYSIGLVVHHRPGKDLKTADALSRAHLGPKFLKIVEQIHGDRIRVPPHYFNWPCLDMTHFLTSGVV